MSELKINTLEIDRRVVRFKDTVVSVRNISEATTFVPQQPLPIVAVILIIVGFLVFFSGFGRQSMWSGITCGLVLMGAGAAWLFVWYMGTQNAPKGITLKLNSGTNITISFPDHDLADRVMKAIEDSMQEEGINLSFELPNATITNSVIGNVASNIGSLLGKRS